MADPIDEIFGAAPVVPNQAQVNAEQPPFPNPGAPAAAQAAPAVGAVDPVDAIFGAPPGVPGPRPAPMPTPNKTIGGVLGSNARAFVTSAPRGFLALPEGIINIENQVMKQIPPGIRNLIPDPYTGVRKALNYATRRDPDGPVDVTGVIDKLLGSANDAKNAPIGSWLGNLAGGALLPVGAFGAGAKIANPLLRSMAQGAIAGGTFGGVNKANEQIKQGQMDYPAIAGSVGMNSVLGAGVGGLLHGIGSFFSPKNEPPVPPGNNPPPPPPAAPPARTIKELRGAYSKFHPKQAEPEPGPIPPGRSISELKAAFSQIYPKPAKAPEVPMPPSHSMAEIKSALKGLNPAARAEKLEKLSLSDLDELIEGPSKVPPVKMRGPGGMKEDGWREERVFNAVPATPKQKAQLHGLVLQKVRWDTSRARMGSAVAQIMSELKLLPPERRTLSPSQWEELAQTVNRLDMKQKKSAPFVETALQTPVTAGYKFKSTTIKGKIVELKALQLTEQMQHNAYDRLRDAAVPLVPHGQPIAVSAGKHTVNVTRKTNPRFIHESQADQAKYDEYLKHRDSLLNDPRQIEPQLTPKALLGEIEKDHELVQQLKDDKVYEFLKGLVFRKGVSQSNPIQAILDIIKVAQLAVRYFKNMGVRFNWRQGFANTLKALKAAKGKIPIRFWQRLTWNQVTSDVIREISPVFGEQRDLYLAAREKATIHGRELLPHERELIGKMTPYEILSDPALKGWTAADRNKEMNARLLDDGYDRLLTGEIKRLENAGVKEGFTGDARYLRMLKLDHQDLGHGFAAASGTDWLTKPAGALARYVIHGEFTSIFLGKNTSSYHIGEAIAANITRDPGSLIQAGRQLVGSAVAQRYANALAGKGMGQRLLETDRVGLAKFVDQLNVAIKNGIEHGVPHGKLVQKIISHELPERWKTGLTAVAAANRVAAKLKYPGGAEQFMADYLAGEEGRTVPPARATLLGKAEVESFIDRNETIMHMPEGPLQERTGFQRHNLIKPWFPFLRSIVQQSRVLTRYMDDFNSAIAKKDLRGAAKAGSSIVALHLITAVMGGKYTLPSYIWEFIRSAFGRERAAQLEDALETLRQLNLLDRRWHHMSLRPVPALEGGTNLLADTARETANFGNISDDPDGRKAARVVAATLAALGVDNIGHTEGTQNLVLLYGHMVDGMKGSKTVKVYSETGILQRIQGKPGKKIGEENIRYDPLTGFTDWALGGETTEEIGVRNRAERLQEMLRQ